MASACLSSRRVLPCTVARTSTALHRYIRCRRQIANPRQIASRNRICHQFGESSSASPSKLGACLSTSWQQWGDSQKTSQQLFPSPSSSVPSMILPSLLPPHVRSPVLAEYNPTGPLRQIRCESQSLFPALFLGRSTRGIHMADVSARCSERRYSRRAASATTSAGADLPRASAEAVDVARADADVAEHDGDVASAGSTREAAVAAGRGKGLLAFYADHHVVPLPAGHRFPMDKYRSTRLLLQSDASLDRILAVHPAPLVSWVELQQVHEEGYLTRLFTHALSEQEQRVLGFPWSPHLLLRSQASCGGTVAATHAVLMGLRRAAGVLAGGTHHAFRGHGEGFCVFNDIAVAALAALTHHPTVCNADRPILALDLDVHQGNGTASIFEGDPRVVTFSMHGANNYPWRSKRRSDYDVELPDDTGDAAYLSLLEQWLPKLFEHHRPSLVMFQAGVDALKEDSFGRLAMTRAGMLRRNNMVYSACIDNHVPLVITMGGGYSRPPDASIAAHADVYRSAAYRFSHL